MGKDRKPRKRLHPSCKKKASSLNPIDAAHFTIDRIVNSYPPPYYLFVSGGADSQSMLWVWKTSGFEFIPISINYNNGMNDHDLHSLQEFSSLYNIDIEYKNFNVIDFLYEEFPVYSERYRCGSPQICTYMKMSELIPDGTAIFSGEFGNYNQNRFIERNNWGLYKYAKLSNRNLVPFFFWETMELSWSFNCKDKSTPKYKIYQDHGFPTIPANKFTGFEKIKDFFDTNFVKKLEVKDKICVKPGQGSQRNFDYLFRHPFEYKYRKDLHRVIFYDE